MRRPTFFILSALALLAALGGSASAAPRPFETGLSGVYAYTPTAYAQVKATGARYVRIGVPWRAIAPEQQPAHWNPEDPGDPNYSWGSVDVGVQNATEQGLIPLLTVSTAPAWAEGCSAPEFPEAVCDPNPEALAQFAVALASRFDGSFEGRPRVTYFQGLNEPNLSLYFLPQYEGGKLVSPTLYRKLMASFYGAVKSVRPSDLVLAGGLGPIAVPHYTSGPLQFARELLCMKGTTKNPKPKAGNCEGGVDFDIFDIHPYTTGGPTHEGGGTDAELGDLPKLVNLLKAADRAGRINGKYKHTPLWATEFSWDTKPPDPYGLPMNTEARWLDEALYLASRDGIEHFFWYSLRDEALIPGQPTSTTLQSGLYFRGATVEEDKPKKIMYAFRFPFVAYPKKGGLLIWGRTPTGTAGQVTVQLKQNGGWRTAVKLKADSHGMFETTLPTSYGTDHKGAARAVFGKTSAVPFSMKPIPDFDHKPFGS